MKTHVAALTRLEDRVGQLASESGVTPEVWQRFIAKLDVLKQHHIGMYAHSLRVGWYAFGLAIEQQRPLPQARLALFGGCGHDIGKSQVPNRFLNAKHMTDKKFAHIQPHAELGYHILKDEFVMTALIAGLHHNVRPNGYGIDYEAQAPNWLQEPLRSQVYQVAQVVCTADCFDALTTRRNDKGLLSETESHDPAAIYRVLSQHFPDRLGDVRWLVDHQIVDEIS
jgi:HD-GYP domain-containing protein (c-di-GMP phosphodiesterase class II)